MVAFVIDGVPHRALWLSVTVGLAVVAFAAAYLLLGETRRQTRVLRAALGYRRGERPWTWRQHVLNVVASVCLLLGAFLASVSEVDAWWVVLAGYWLLMLGATALSAVQKRRHERSDRARFGPPESYAAARRFG